MTLATIFLAACLIGDLWLVSNLNGDVTMEVASGKHERRDTPISVVLPPSMRDARQRLSLQRMSDDREVRV